LVQAIFKKVLQHFWKKEKLLSKEIKSVLINRF